MLPEKLDSKKDITIIDLRSDTVTRPTPEMLAAMMAAPTGDDVYGEDPSVNELEAYAAELTGKEAGLFAASGTMSNLIGLLAHCDRGDEYIVGSTAHTYMFEGGGAATLGGIQPCTIPFNSDGELPLDKVAALIKPDDVHFARSKLLCLENTQGGKVLSLGYLAAASALATKHGLKHHLDGARVFNAAVQLQVPVKEICQHFDSVSICLSKGLGCAVGSLLVGDKDTIKIARRYRKMVGGGMRQAGILAAGGLYSLKNNINRMQQDHDNAKYFSESITGNKNLTIAEPVQTNMVMLHDDVDIAGLIRHLAAQDIKLSGRRLVFHQDISKRDTERLVDCCLGFKA